MKKYALEIKWGVIFSIMTLLWMVLEKLAGLHDKHIDVHPIVTNFIMIPAVLTYVLALREKKKSLGGTITYKQGFISGLIITAVVTILTPLTQYLTIHVITPDFFHNAIEYAVWNNKSTRKEAEAYFSERNYMIQSVLFAPVAGIITSAVVAYFAQRRSAKS